MEKKHETLKPHYIHHCHGQQRYIPNPRVVSSSCIMHFSILCLCAGAAPKLKTQV